TPLESCGVLARPAKRPFPHSRTPSVAAPRLPRAGRPCRGDQRPWHGRLDRAALPRENALPLLSPACPPCVAGFFSEVARHAAPGLQCRAAPNALGPDPSFRRTPHQWLLSPPHRGETR